MRAHERVGAALGWAISPFVGAIAALRGARLFQPDGLVLSATVEPIATEARAQELARRLAGPALVRFSGALWRGGRERPDTLGCAVRFRSSDRATWVPDSGDQDLLFATAQGSLTTLLGPLRTHVPDFLADPYFATAPFDVRGVGAAKLRLVPEHPSVGDGDRVQRLLSTAQRGEASLRLELRRAFRRTWVPVARIRLQSAARVDQERLRFWPFRDGRGLRPRGFVHALRRGAYRASQAAGHA